MWDIIISSYPPGPNSSVLLYFLGEIKITKSYLWGFIGPDIFQENVSDLFEVFATVHLYIYNVLLITKRLHRLNKGSIESPIETCGSGIKDQCRKVFFRDE